LNDIASGVAQRGGQSEADVKKAWAEQVPLKRLGDPRETAEAIAFLASPLAGYISGVHLPVDGGRTGAL
jgi:3-oxoacyl-[acyl-carrier protein] reductase